jgi:hypothetical protein
VAVVFFVIVAYYPPFRMICFVVCIVHSSSLVVSSPCSRPAPPLRVIC